MSEDLIEIPAIEAEPEEQKTVATDTTTAIEQNQSEPLVIEDCEHKRPEETDTVEIVETTESVKVEPAEEKASINPAPTVELSVSTAEEPTAYVLTTVDPKAEVTEAVTGSDSELSEPKEEFHVALDAQGEPKLETVVYPKAEIVPDKVIVEPESVPVPEFKVDQPVVEEQIQASPTKDSVTSSNEPADIQQWRKDGTHKARVYTYDKLGFHLVTEDHGTVDPKQIATWEATMNEYFAAHPTETV